MYIYIYIYDVCSVTHCAWGIHVNMWEWNHSYGWFMCTLALTIQNIETWLIPACDMTHSCVWHDSFICVTRLIYVCDMTHSYLWHDSFVNVTWLIHMCDMAHSCVRHGSFICATWLIHMCDMTHSCQMSDMAHSKRQTDTHGSILRATWLIDMRVMTHSHEWHDSFIWVIWLIPRDTPMHMAVFYAWHDSSICVTWLINRRDMTVGWLRFVGSLKW